MRVHSRADAGLLADDHGLQDARVAEAQVAGDGGVTGPCAYTIVRVSGGGRGGHGDLSKGRGEDVEGMADFIDGEGLWLAQLGRGGVGDEGVRLEEEMDFVAGGEEVLVADVFCLGVVGAVACVVVGLVAGREAG